MDGQIYLVLLAEFVEAHHRHQKRVGHKVFDAHFLGRVEHLAKVRTGRL